MRSFADIYARAVARKGSKKAVEAAIPRPQSAAALRRIADDRWLAQIAKSVFQAGFVWRVVENKWPDFEDVFAGFDLHAVAYLSDEDIERLVGNPKIIRHHKKILATRENAVFLLDVVAEHGSVGTFVADFGPRRYVELLDVLRRRGARLGGMSAQYCLRRLGVDSFVLSRDVVKVLVDEDVVRKAPGSKRDLAAVQRAFDTWCEESGRPLTAVSRVLAMSVD